MGIGEGSKLWERNGAVLRSTINLVADRDSTRLLPMDGYLRGAIPVPGFRVPA